MLNAELAIVARKEGFRELVDLAKVGLNFPTSSIVTTRTFIKRNENTVRKFIRGYVEGVHYGKTQRAFGVQVLKKYLRNDDTAFVNDLYDLYILQNIPQIPRPSPEALKTVLDQMAESDSEWRTFVRSNLSMPAFSKNWKRKVSFSACGNEDRRDNSVLTTEGDKSSASLRLV